MDICARREHRCLVLGLQIATGERLGLTVDRCARRELYFMVSGLQVATGECLGLTVDSRASWEQRRPLLGLLIATRERLKLTMDLLCKKGTPLSGVWRTYTHYRVFWADDGQLCKKGTPLPGVGLTDSHLRTHAVTMYSCARRNLRNLGWVLQIAIGERSS